MLSPGSEVDANVALALLGAMARRRSALMNVQFNKLLQHVHQRAPVRLAEWLKNRPLMILRKFHQLLSQTLSLRGRRNANAAAIAFINVSSQQPEALHSINGATHGRLLALGNVRQFFYRQCAFVQTCKNAPVRHWDSPSRKRLVKFTRNKEARARQQVREVPVYKPRFMAVRQRHGRFVNCIS